MISPSQRAVGWFERMFIDHAIFRLTHHNLSEVATGVWRSSQPGPRDIRRMKAMGINTIVNLRGNRDCASYLLEVAACRRHGIELIDFPIRSREPPSRETLHALKPLFAPIRRPVLFHCKVGADRAGIMAALYLLVIEDAAVEVAQRQLSWRFGHVRYSRAGILDQFLEDYRLHHAQTGEDFLSWVDTTYDQLAMKRNFSSAKWADILYDRLLKRE